MKKVFAAVGCLGILCVGIIFAAVVAIAIAVGDDNTSGSLENAGMQSGYGGGINDTAEVPAWIRPLVADAIARFGCPEVTASLIAAQIYGESSFNPRAESYDKETGAVLARGLTQFIADTWAAHAVDGDGNGVKDVWDPKDAVPSQVAYDCYVAGLVRKVAGDATDNMLAAYNAGPNRVLQYGGVPPYSDTRAYIKQIRDLATKWAAVGDSGGVPLPAGSEGAARAIATARTALGTPYQWGGDCRPPFDSGRNNGCDCSSLVKYAWASAGVNLPRVTYDQVRFGTPVQSIEQLVPDDLLFSVGAATHPEHVGMYIGNGEVIEAPRPGVDVRIKPISWWTNQVVAMRHIA
jgi:cell wall-associated NlpC family hydrolase